MAKKDFWSYTEDFFGTGVVTATQADNNRWRLAITGAGPPTGALVTPSSSGEFTLDHSSDTQIQNICLYQSDILQYDIDKIREVEFRVKMNQAALDATTTSMVAFGLTNARNDTINTITRSILFRVVGTTSLTSLRVETDDGSAETSLVDTGTTLINAYKECKISFAEGTGDLRFFVDGVPVATSTTFDMSNETGSLQLFAQLQKTSDNGTDGITFDRISIRGVR